MSDRISLFRAQAEEYRHSLFWPINSQP